MAKILNSDDEAIKQFCSKFPLRYFKKDRPLFYQGEVPHTAFYIKSGVVKVYNITTAGEEKIVSYESTGGLVPTGWIFERSKVALYYYDTFTDSQLYSIPKKELMDYINSNKAAALTLLNHYMSMYVGTTMHLHALEQSRARDKVLHIMQYLVLRFSKPVSKNHYRIELRLTHQDIANLVGVTRETVTSEISKLAKTGVLRSENFHYIIDTDKALRMLGEKDFDQLSL
jgi:CRP/FNR family cyclic AMP-dependent transcriptional regulator